MTSNVESIFDFNLEINHFINLLKKHASFPNVIDLNTADYLLDLVSKVNSFLDETSLVDTQKLTSLDNINLASNKILIQRNFDCKVCKMQIKSTKEGLKTHIQSTTHRNGLKNFNKKDGAGGNNVQPVPTKSTPISRQTLELPKTRSNSSMTDSKTDLSLREPSPKPQPAVKVRERNAFREIKFLSADSIPKYKENMNKNLKKFLESVNIGPFIEEKIKQAETLLYSSNHDIIKEDIKRFLIEKYPNIKIYTFGSRLSGLGAIDSDLDLYIDVDNYYNGSAKNTKESMKQMIEETLLTLRKTAQWSKFEPIRGARTPILRAWNNNLKVDCDMSFSNGLSHSNTALVRYLLKLQPICQRVAIFVKFWTSYADMNGMNSYAVTLMVIFYFQTKKLLPSVKQLQDAVEPFFITYWQANYQEPELLQLDISEVDDLRQHLIGFFEFYGSQFSFGKFVICPLLGYAIRKRIFNPEDLNLPPEMGLYEKYMEQLDVNNADKVIDLFAYEKPIVVQDPFELNHNVAKSMKAGMVAKFIDYCKQTANFLKNNKKFE